MAVFHSMPQALSPMELACLNKVQFLGTSMFSIRTWEELPVSPSGSKVNILHS